MQFFCNFFFDKNGDILTTYLYLYQSPFFASLDFGLDLDVLFFLFFSLWFEYYLFTMKKSSILQTEIGIQFRIQETQNQFQMILKWFFIFVTKRFHFGISSRWILGFGIPIIIPYSLAFHWHYSSAIKYFTVILRALAIFWSWK